MSKKILLDKINVPGIKTYEVYRREGGYTSVEKALKTLLPYEMELLREWLLNYTVSKPELKQCLILVNS